MEAYRIFFRSLMRRGSRANGSPGKRPPTPSKARRISLSATGTDLTLDSLLSLRQPWKVTDIFLKEYNIGVHSLVYPPKRQEVVIKIGHVASRRSVAGRKPS